MTGWPEHAPRRLLAALDGSPTSLRAAEAALAMAQRTHADVVLLHVVDEERVREIAALIGRDHDEARRRLEESGRRALEPAVELAKSRGVPCTARIEAGDPPHAIDEVAREVDADMIVVGKVGQRGVRRWFVGGTARRLIESTRVPVVVISGAPEAG